MGAQFTLSTKSTPVGGRLVGSLNQSRISGNPLPGGRYAGISPSSASGDYSDVTVISPYGAVPWPKVSRLNEDEMKRLMIDVFDRTYRFIHTLFDENTGGELLLRLAHRDPLPQWKDPRLLAGDASKRGAD